MSWISRHLNILDYAIALLARKKVRNSAIIVVYALIIFLLSSLYLVTSALQEVSEKILRTVPDITVQKMSAGRQVPLIVDGEDLFSGIYGISTIRQRVWGYYFDEKNGANYTIIGMQEDALSSQLSQLLYEGQMPASSGQVVLSRAVAKSLHLEGRKNFSLFRPDLTLKGFTKVGEFPPESILVTGDLISMSLADAQDLFAMNANEVTDLLVSVANPVEIDTIAEKLTQKLPGSRIITKKQIQKTYQVVFSWRSGIGGVCLLGSLFAFIILAWDRASGLSPQEKREMAILKIIGWQSTDIMVMRFWEAGIIGGISFLIGYLSSWVHIVYSDLILFKPLILGWSILRPPYQITPFFSFTDLMLILCCCVLPYMAATIVPAWRSSMVRTDMVI